MVLETARLLLREYTLADIDVLFEILSDAETMQHYPKPYTKEDIDKLVTTQKEY